MAKRYNQKPVFTGVTRFTKAPMAEVEFSRMTSNPQVLTTFNAGDIVPVHYEEILPHSTFSMDTNFIIRQMTALYPTMGQMQVDLFAYFVPNRIICDSWKNIQGENTSGFWSAPEVELAPLYTGSQNVQIPVGSVADYYGFPTQRPIQASVLRSCNQLKFLGYLAIYNNEFRDENYMPPIPYSRLNVTQGFMLPKNSNINLGGGASSGSYSVPLNTKSDGSCPNGAVVKALYGEGSSSRGTITINSSQLTSFSALDKPLKACKLHDPFTSVLPAPQKGAEVYFSPSDGPIPIEFNTLENATKFESGNGLRFTTSGDSTGARNLFVSGYGADGAGKFVRVDNNVINDVGEGEDIDGWNITAKIAGGEIPGVSINDFRTAVATQQVLETFARGGSRYVEYLESFFGISTENPFKDIPTKIGHIRRNLDLFQVAQTSATQDGSTPQGELTAFGYTDNGGHMFEYTALEHGYIHILCVVRHQNLYTSYMAPDNFRMGTLDFYLPQFANITEQPIKKAILNPFKSDSMSRSLGYQEAFWEYRYSPSRCSGYFRTGIEGSLSAWNYADDFDESFDVVAGNWLKSNSEEVLNRGLAVTSDVAPQFKALFSFKIEKNLPMPTFSVPGLDII